MPKNIINEKFGKLTVIKFSHTINGKRGMWLCKCDCGKEKIIRRDGLTSGHNTSCGCSILNNKKKYPLEYSVWQALRKRCNNKNNPHYANYGGRGINVCKEWDNFQTFLKDIGPRPSAKHSIDRIDNNKGYSPDNCRWATSFEQASNKRDNRYITINGETKILAEWLRIKHVSKRGFMLRVKRGHSEEEALTLPHKTWRNKI